MNIFRSSGYFLRGSYEVKVNLRVPTACCCALWIDNNQSIRVQQTPACLLSTGRVILSPCRCTHKMRIRFQSLYFSFLRMWWKTCYPGAPPHATVTITPSDPCSFFLFFWQYRQRWIWLDKARKHLLSITRRLPCGLGFSFIKASAQICHFMV